MIDQNKPYEENTSLPASPPASPNRGESQGGPTSPVGEISPTVDPLANREKVESTVPPPTSTVVVPAGSSEVPKWFYFLFGITIIVFFLVTTLLVLQLTQKQVGNLESVPTVVPKVTSTSSLPTPTIIATNLATDSAVTKLNDSGNTDDITSIEMDLKGTDLAVLDQSISEVDVQVNNSF